MSQRISTVNQLENKHFTLILDRIPHVEYFCTSASIPGISTTSPRYHSPFTEIKLTGDKAIYQPLIVNFIVDENLENWSELHDWIVSYTHPTSFDEYRNSEVSQNNLYSSKVSDAKLLIPNNKYNTSHEFHFVEVFPIDLSDTVFDIQISDSQSQICTATFEYTYYKKTS